MPRFFKFVPWWTTSLSIFLFIGITLWCVSCVYTLNMIDEGLTLMEVATYTDTFTTGRWVIAIMTTLFIIVGLITLVVAISRRWLKLKNDREANTAVSNRWLAILGSIITMWWIASLLMTVVVLLQSSVFIVVYSSDKFIMNNLMSVINSMDPSKAYPPPAPPAPPPFPSDNGNSTLSPIHPEPGLCNHTSNNTSNNSSSESDCLRQQLLDRIPSREEVLLQILIQYFSSYVDLNETSDYEFNETAFHQCGQGCMFVGGLQTYLNMDSKCLCLSGPVAQLDEAVNEAVSYQTSAFVGAFMVFLASSLLIITNSADYGATRRELSLVNEGLLVQAESKMLLSSSAGSEPPLKRGKSRKMREVADHQAASSDYDDEEQGFKIRPSVRVQGLYANGGSMKRLDENGEGVPWNVNTLGDIKLAHGSLVPQSSDGDLIPERSSKSSVSKGFSKMVSSTKRGGKSISKFFKKSGNL